MRRIAASLSIVLIALTIATNALASSNPIPGVGIVVKRPPGSSTARTTTDKDGNFRIEGLEPGTYTIEVVQEHIDMYFAESTATTAKLRPKKGDTSDGLSASTEISDKRRASQTDIAEMCISSSREITIDGTTRNAGEKKFYPVDAGLMTVTVDKDGVISGQLRAGVSTSRSNIRSKK